MTTRKLEIVIVGDASSANKALDSVGETGQRLEGKISGLGSAFGTVAATAGGFVLGSAIQQGPGALLAMAQGAAEDEAATMRLEQALRNAGGSFDDHIAKVNERIDAGAELAFSDDEVRDSFQTLLAATGDVDTALQRQAAAMDLARGAGIPLEAASRMLGKLNGENVEVFKRLGITLGENATEADALAAVQAKFGGQADAYAQSTAGQFQVASIKMAELKESIGAALLPVMTILAGALAGQVIPAMQGVADAITPVVASIAQFAGPVFEALQAVIPFLAPIGAAIGAVAAVILATYIPALVAWAAAEVAKTAAMLAAAAAFVVANAPLIAIAAAVALLVAGVVLLVQHWDQIVAKVPALGVAFEAVKAAISTIVAWFTGTFIPAVDTAAGHVSAAFSAAVGPVTTAVGAVSSAIEGVIKAFEPMIRGAIGPAIAVFEAQFTIAKEAVELVLNLLSVQIETILGVIQGIISVAMGLLTGDWDRAWHGLQTIAESVWGGIQGTFSAIAGFITGIIPAVLEAATALGAAILDGLKTGLTAAGGFVSDIASAVVQAVKGAVNYVIDQINGALVLTIPVPFAKDITVDAPDIPHLKDGGLVVVGDNPSGIEAVIPLERWPEVMGQAAGRGGGAPVIIHNHFHGFVGDVDELMRTIDLKLKRSGGGRVLGNL
ncbi:MAG: hypothetical protein IT303_11655 [Dehalococcoidia bacterium]|nr:hypothetical protein [Dehalococcoidia bacterium]